MADTILEVKDLRVSYAGRVAVSNVSLEIKPGEIFGLLGPNGAGKTSTLSAIEGLIIPQAGSIFIAGVDVLKDPREARANIGVQLQATSFQQDLSVGEILDLYAGLYGVKLNSSQKNAIIDDMMTPAKKPDSFPEASNSALPLRRRLFIIRRYYFSMNRRLAWIRNRGAICGIASKQCAIPAAVFYLPPIRWKRRVRYAIALQLLITEK
jgi:ABC-type Fe3+/spermidine/putrescine transport system ATPase subunit